MQQPAFEHVDLGYDLGPLRLNLSSEQVRHYAQVANMPGGRFFSDEAAQREGLPGQIVPGNLSLALFSRLLAEALPGARLANLGATFRALVRPGTALVVRGVVIDRTANDDRDSIECELVLETAEGDRLVTGSATVVLRGCLTAPSAHG